MVWKKQGLGSSLINNNLGLIMNENLDSFLNDLILIDEEIEKIEDDIWYKNQKIDERRKKIREILKQSLQINDSQADQISQIDELQDSKKYSTSVIHQILINEDDEKKLIKSILRKINPKPVIFLVH